MQSVRLELVDPDETRRRSVGAVTNPVAFTKSIPNPDGINSLLTGPSDRSTRCSTCKHGLACVGHFMHIDLAFPVYHTGYIGLLVKLLRCLCHACSRIIVDTPPTDLDRIITLAKTKTACPHCAYPHPDVHPGGDFGIEAVYAPDTAFESPEEEAYARRPFTPEVALQILKHANHETYAILGFDKTLSNPAHMVLTVLPVLPLTARPAVSYSECSRVKAQNPLTQRYTNIVKINQGLHDAEDEDKMKLWLDLQVHVGAFVHREPRMSTAVGGAANGGYRSQRQKLANVEKLLKGKEGQFRGNVMGKRVNGGARTVVVGQPVRDMDVIGVPKDIAEKLTFNERVFDGNVGAMTTLMRNGQLRAVISPEGERVDLKLLKNDAAVHIGPGCIVERYMANGDLVIMNRQPTLHKMGFMAFKAYITQNRTFELPLSVTTPLNADFDGDELNLHFVGAEARAEMEHLLMVSRQIVSAASNKPIIALVQDALIGVYLLTQPDTLLDKAQAMQLYMQIHYPYKPFPPPSILKPVALWTGKTLFSVLLPPTLYFDEKVEHDVEERVLVQAGELLDGTLCKRTMGTSANGLVHLVFNDCGHEAANHLISDAQRITGEYILKRGFSIGLQDCFMRPGGSEAVEGVVHRTLDRVAHLQAASSNNLKAVEDSVLKLLQGVLPNAAAAVKKHMHPTNSVLASVNSGAKGGPVNYTQIMGVVGQQCPQGRRVAPLPTTNRTLPCFKPGDASAPARGFMENSFMTGLDAPDFFFHAMAGREGLIDTACKTGQVGYVQRQIMAVMANLTIEWGAGGGLVLDAATNRVVQFKYGGEGYDSAKLEKRKLPALLMSPTEMKAWVGHVGLARKLEALCIQLRHAWMVPGTVLSTDVRMPFEPVRLMRQCSSDVTPTVSDLEDMLDKLCIRISRVLGSRASLTTRAFARCWITPKLVNELRPNLRRLQERIVELVERAVVEPGEMVGPLAGQSMSEPATQMTLNTFHVAGTGMTGTSGLERLMALIRVTKAPPEAGFMTTRMRLETEEEAKRMCVRIEHLPLGRLVTSSSVIYEPGVWDTQFESDKFAVRTAQLLFTGGSTSAYSKHVIRFILDRAALGARNMVPKDVADALLRSLGDTEVQVIRSERTETDWIVRIRLLDALSLMQGAPPGGDAMELERVALQEAHDQMLKIAVRGIENIRKAVPQRERESVLMDGKVSTREFWSVLSQGVNLQRVFNTVGVDAARVGCNDIHEVCAVLGIDAAARVLYDELVKVLSSNGTFVNPRHMQLLVDLMTHGGKLTAVSRHGMSQMSDSILQRACFEQAMDVLRNGAVKGAKDSLTCVTAALMMGTTPPVGTGRVHTITTHTTTVAVKPLLYTAPIEVDEEMPSAQQWLFAPGSPPASREWTFEPMSP